LTALAKRGGKGMSTSGMIESQLITASGVIALLLAALVPGLGAQAFKQKAQDKQEHSGNKSKSSLVDERGAHATLWREPGAIENLNLVYGAGGAEGAPDVSGRFTFVRRLLSGTSKKIVVKDDKGREWIVKFGPEVRPETAATRFVWAMGYHVDEDYFVKQAHIEGMRGEATNVRFKRTHNGYHQMGLWNWDSNYFKGTRELDGLKVLMALLNNWDLKDDNNSVVQRRDKDSGGNPDERIYYVSDLGASFGSTGSLGRKVLFFADPPAGTKDDPSGYAHQAFIDGVSNGEVQFHYKGKDRDTLKGIKVETARWMGDMLGRLSEKQLEDAFRGAGFKDVEVATYVRAMQERIAELRNLK
jgi:hypothetical protein